MKYAPPRLVLAMILLLCLAAPAVSRAAEQNYSLGQGYRITRGDAQATVFDLALAPDGSVYTLTWLGTGGGSFGQDGDTSAVTLTTQGSRRVALARYQPDGRLAWARLTENIANIPLQPADTHLLALPDGRVVTSGLFSGTVTFGQGETNETTLTTPRANGIYLACHQTDGRLAWVLDLTYAQTESISLNDIWLRPDGKLQTFRQIFQSSPNPVAQNIWINPVSPNGEFVVPICVMVSDATMGRIKEMDLAADGGTIMASEFTDKVIVPLVNGQELLSAGGQDIYLLRYTASPELAWARRIGGPNNEILARIAATPDGGTLVAGYFTGTITLDQDAAQPPVTLVAGGTYDLFLARYTAGGQVAWARDISCNRYLNLPGLAALPDGGAQLAGYFSGAATVSNGQADAVSLASIKNYTDIFLVRYGAEGRLISARADGGPGDEVLRGMAIAPGGRVLAAGVYGTLSTYKGITTLGRGDATQTDLPVAQGADSFLTLYRPAIQVLAPNGGERLAAGQPFKVSWETELNAAGSAVRLELWNGQGKVADLGQDWQPDGHNTLTLILPATLPAGDYRLRAVSDYVPALWDESDQPFIVTAAGSAVPGGDWAAYE